MPKRYGNGKRRKMTKFAIDEIAAVDFGAQETARAVLMKRDTTRSEKDSGLEFGSFFVVKNGDESTVVLITSEEDGHTHAIHLWRGALGGETSYSMGSDDEHGHGHPWAFDGNGNITIGANDGHDHEVDATTVFRAVMSMQKGVTKRQISTLVRKGIEIDEDAFPIETKMDVAEAIQAFGRAKDPEDAADYIRGAAIALDAEDIVPKDGALAFPDDSKAETLGEESKMAKTDPEKDTASSIRKLEAQVARFEKIDALGDEYRPYFRSLDKKDQDAFLDLGDDDRAAAVAKFQKAKADSNPIVFTSDDGTEYRKNDDHRIVKMARERDEDRKALRKAQADAEEATFLKRAQDELPSLPGAPTVRARLLKALDSISDEEVRGHAYMALKAADNAMRGSFSRHGTTSTDIGLDPASAAPGTSEASHAQVQLDQLVQKRMEKDSIGEAEAYVKVLDTPEGAQLYAKTAAQ